MKKILIIALMGVALSSCKDWLDINYDPNKPAEVPYELVLPQAELGLAMSYCGIMFNEGGFLSQYYCAGYGNPNFRSQTIYDLTANSGNASYDRMYAYSLNNAQDVINRAKAAGDGAHVLAATALKAYGMQAMVDMFGEVPYSEAFGGLALSMPKYDAGKDIYAGILKELDDALDNFGTLYSVTDENLLFGEDSDGEWISFARALKLKLLMRQAIVNPTEVSPKVMALIAEGGFPTEDVAFTCWSTTTGQTNPWFDDASIFMGKAAHEASYAYIATMTSYNDPRLGSKFTPPAGKAQRGDYPGNSAILNEDNVLSTMSKPVYNALAPAYLITLAEIQFFIAEAELRWGSAANAKVAYEAAVQASFTQCGAGSAAAILATNDYSWDAAANKYKLLGIQKWLALGHVNNFEAYCEIRRLGFPAFGANTASDFSDASGNTIAGVNYVPGELVYPKGGVPAYLSSAKSIVNTYFYPEVSVSKNQNVKQKSSANGLLQKPFWML